MELSFEQCSVAAQVISTVLVAAALSSNLDTLRNQRRTESFSWWTYDAHGMTVHLLMGLMSLGLFMVGVFGGGLSQTVGGVAIFGAFATLTVFAAQVVQRLFRGRPESFNESEGDS